MAAALWNALGDPQKTRAVSAGTEPAGRLHPEVATALAERGIDVSSLKPQRLTAELLAEASLLVTMGCGETCISEPGAPKLRRLDWPLPDPKGQPLETVRAIRDDIERRVRALLVAEGLASSR
jgi:arsenate reductase